MRECFPVGVGGGVGMLQTQFLLDLWTDTGHGAHAAVHGGAAAEISEIRITGCHAKEANGDI